LIFKISLIFEEDACVYNHSVLMLEFSIGILPFFWKNFDFFKTSILGLGGIGRKTLEVLALFPDLLDSVFLLDLFCKFLDMNLAEIHC